MFISSYILLFRRIKCSIDFPNELVLDGLNTTFESNFTAEDYPGANLTAERAAELEGQPVLVLTIKSTPASGVATTDYHFIDLTYLVDTYTVNTDNGDTVSTQALEINGYKLKFKISSTAGNLIRSDANGLYVGADDKKANKVAHEEEEDLSGVIPQLTANGDLAKSTVKKWK